MISFLAQRRWALLSLLAAALLGAMAIPAEAEDAYPSKPIRLIVPFPPGGGTDDLSRAIAERLTAAKGWTFVIDNRPGVGGNIGLDAVAKSKPDGYTIGMAQTANLAINPTLYTKLPFNPQKDFTPISLIASQAVLFVVRDESPFRTLADLVNAARAQPGVLTMASAGTGTTGHLTGELFAKRAGVKITHVPYRGFGPALTDLVGGRTDMLLTSPQSGQPMLRAGKLRALAISSPRRLDLLPEVPTISELGYKGFEATDWKGLVGPAGLPKNVLQVLNTEVEKVLRSPEIAHRFGAEGGTPLGGTPEHMAEFIKSEQVRWGAAVRESGATAE